MKFLSVGGKNFLSLETFHIELDDRGLLLIQGENKSDTSANSNGAGKSSIPDAVSWACYGQTARGLSGDAVVNNTAKKDTEVEVVLLDGPMTYRITRYRKHATHKNQVFVYQKDAAGVETDLSKGTDKETQLVINKIIGASAEVFNAAIYAGQEKLPDLPGMTDKSLKVLLEESAGTEELTECYTLARADALASTKKLDLLQQSIRDSNEALETGKSRLTDANNSVTEFEATRRDRAKDHLSHIPPVSALIATINAELAALDEPAVTAKATAAQTKIKSVEAEKTELNRLTGEFNVAIRAFSVAEVTEKNTLEAFKRAKQALESVDDQVGKPCSECGKSYCTEDLEVVRVKRKAEFETAKSNAIAAKTESTKLAGIAADAEQAVNSFKSTMTDVSAEAQTLEEQTAILRDIADKKSKITGYETSVENLKKQASAKLTEPNPHLIHVESAKKHIEEIEKALLAKTTEAADMAGECEMLENIVKVFSPAGVRAHILDSITPFLNDRTRDYLGAFTDGNIHAVWSTLTKTAKGELKEKFNIEVSHDLGGDSFQALSGGEKRKVRLACAMALQEMVASRATKPIGLFIADEIDDALDDAGLERLMGILDKRAKHQGTVLVISHNGLADWVDQVIVVEKVGKLSTVGGATRKTF